MHVEKSPYEFQPETIEFLLSAAIHKCESLEDAKDLAQETLLSALCHLSKGGEIRDMKAWLVTVMNRRFYDKLRKKYKLPVISYDACSDALADYSDHTDELIRQEEAEAVRREIAYLSLIYRDIIVRRYMKNESIEQIAKALKIPAGTVKSRLSGGREQIRKGIETMESYVKQSYEPDELWLCNSGKPGLNGEPMSLVNDDKIAQNLLILAYDSPKTEEELSKAIGIPASYIEPVIKKLIDNELMAKTPSGRVYTDFIIFNRDERSKHIPKQIKFVKDNFDRIYNPINNALTKLRKTAFYKGFNARQQKKSEFYAAMYILERVYIDSLSAINPEFFKELPDRPNGGKWIALGNLRRHDDGPQTHLWEQKFFYSGRRLAYGEHCMQARLIMLLEYDTYFDDYGYYRYLPYDIGTEEMAKFLYVIDSKMDPEETGLNLRLLENIPELLKKGVLRKDGDILSVDLPVMTSGDFNTMEAYLKDAIKLIVGEIREPLKEHLKSVKTEIPKHLKSVPLEKQYQCGVQNLPPIFINEMIERKLVGKIDFPCPPAVLVIDR